jgi:hypothetical protein
MEDDMPRMMVAASPVEIEAKAEEAGFAPEAHEAALHLFHVLTDRIAKAAIARETAHETWPNRRFYFGTPGAEMGALLEGLEARADIVDVARGQDRREEPDGLFGREAGGGFVGVLVAHRNHEGFRAGA